MLDLGQIIYLKLEKARGTLEALTCMSWSYETIRGTILLVLAIVVIALFMYTWVKRSRDPGALIARWAITLAILTLVVWSVDKLFRKEQAATSLAGLGIAITGGLVFAVLWVPPIVDFVSRKIGSLYDGGEQEVEPRPFYSIFRAKRIKGQYFEALDEVRRQLDKFPTDFEGMMLLAELQAENLNDLPGAEITVQKLCEQPGHSPVNIAYALGRIADWHLGLSKDRDAAQKSLEKIMELLPDTEMAARAAQRIAHLADASMLLAPHDRQRVSVKKGVENLGLHREQGKLKAPEIDQGLVAAGYVEHLEKHPLDTHAREKLAVLYANHYHRLDMALDQLEQLVQQPNNPAKMVVHWLNLMADLQVQEGADLESVRGTLKRIVDQFPDIAAAENAQRRMDTVKLELKAKEKSRAVELGSYEQNIGLKRKA
ncbi:MAG: hypothetical protein JWR26_2752 [Pedosphaera sp.]|nr:hypothetical protein [Pedosphaera sp.]